MFTLQTMNDKFISSWRKRKASDLCEENAASKVTMTSLHALLLYICAFVHVTRWCFNDD